MSGTLNKVMLIGHLGDDVKVTYFEGGGAIGRFPLATNDSYTNRQTGERVTNTEWHNIVVRNKGAEICEKYLSKGDKVYVEGRLRNRQWQGEDGVTRYTTEVHVNDFTFLSNKNEGQGSSMQGPSQSSYNNNAPQRAQQPSQSQPQSTPQSNSFVQDDDDDLPF
ncbi:single-strand DNA-binding protein [Pustulibacterium marinum]|uniref:Single-stranded DNA-binding protein n=1 Tax=Pustulibacterium marinum TaxID=1224947 RepID=A0A1I7HCL7_9FLAO|nr:single-stranded DNA-binding protein [Pustulibacterium marinum]SFU58458.1 single-strand DNA-binding protein [Pustulibacterium marinum]